MQMRNLATIPTPYQRMPWRTRIARNIAPNDVLWFEQVVVLEVKQSSNGDDWPVNWNGVQYVLEAENTQSGVQGYIRLIDRNNHYVERETIRNYIRKVNGIPPRESEREGFGSYHWIDRNFNPINSSLPTRGFTYADDPPWM